MELSFIIISFESIGKTMPEPHETDHQTAHDLFGYLPTAQYASFHLYDNIPQKCIVHNKKYNIIQYSVQTRVGFYRPDIIRPQLI